MFFPALLCAFGDYYNSKQKAKQHTENLTANESYKTQIKVLPFPGLA